MAAICSPLLAASACKGQEPEQGISRVVSETLARRFSTSDGAIIALAQLGSPAVPRIVQLLEGDEYQFKGTLVDALARIGDPAAVEPLVRYYPAARESLKDNILMALGALKGEQARQFLRQKAKDQAEPPALRVFAEAMLVRAGDEGAARRTRQKAVRYYELVERLESADAVADEKDRARDELRGLVGEATDQMGAEALFEQFASVGDPEVLRLMYIWGNRESAQVVQDLTGIQNAEAVQLLFEIACGDVVPKRGREKGQVPFPTELAAAKVILEGRMVLKAEDASRLLRSMVGGATDYLDRISEYENQLAFRHARLQREIERFAENVRQYETNTGEKFEWQEPVPSANISVRSQESKERGSDMPPTNEH